MSYEPHSHEQEQRRSIDVESTTQRFPESMKGAALSVLWWSEDVTQESRDENDARDLGAG